MPNIKSKIVRHDLVSVEQITTCICFIAFPTSVTARAAHSMSFARERTSKRAPSADCKCVRASRNAPGYSTSCMAKSSSSRLVCANKSDRVLRGNALCKRLAPIRDATFVPTNDSSGTPSPSASAPTEPELNGVVSKAISAARNRLRCSALDRYLAGLKYKRVGATPRAVDSERSLCVCQLPLRTDVNHSTAFGILLRICAQISNTEGVIFIGFHR